eukprot:4359050-Prymnesium_polylepis.1
MVLRTATRDRSAHLSCRMDPPAGRPCGSHRPHAVGVKRRARGPRAWTVCARGPQAVGCMACAWVWHWQFSARGSRRECLAVCRAIPERGEMARLGCEVLLADATITWSGFDMPPRALAGGASPYTRWSQRALMVSARP